MRLNGPAATSPQDRRLQRRGQLIGKDVVHLDEDAARILAGALGGGKLRPAQLAGELHFAL